MEGLVCGAITEEGVYIHGGNEAMDPVAQKGALPVGEGSVMVYSLYRSKSLVRAHTFCCNTLPQTNGLGLF